MVPRGCFSGDPTEYPDDMATTDHVYPRRLRPMMAPEKWYRLNKVPACNACNNRKADLHPDVWIASIGKARHAAVADRLTRLNALSASLAVGEAA